ncbi:MAG: hypothetical protein IJU43_03865 [Lachnospiraceae bacterium]|nr:hypothetical protein [Lachnospiraceae bacterium]
MFNDNLKKFNNVIAVLMSAIFAAGVLIGCGAKAEDPGGSEAIAAEKSTEEQVIVTEDDVITEDVTPEDDELPPLAYKTVEERMQQGKHKDSTGFDSANRFFMLEEICDTPEGGFPEKSEEGLTYSNGDYLKLKGTLYELRYNGRPANSSIYFPGDELPEGYTVEVTEDYEFTPVDCKNFE